TACSIAVRIGEYMEDCIVKANIVGNLMMGGDYPVVFYGNAYNLKLTSNVFHDNINPPYIELGILYARFNEGYVTENKGTSTISASTSVTFAHGLASAATHVNVKFKSGGYGRWTWSSDSTYITITVTKSGTYTFSWSADMYG
ncbi:hypothetical protein MUP00_09020, partial [Candidatus Bathyarchaeota archaeon]|nr:hypothetical protein [Candidatus Bathyarchaeota archaeon]